MPRAWLLLSVLVVALDYASKQLALSHLVLHEPWVITPFFNLTLIHNTGAAFGFLSSLQPTWERWLLAGVSLSATVYFFHWYSTAQIPLQRVALALLMGGAVGNLIDRLFFGSVVDFIQLHAGPYYYPAFNLADSAITLGVVLLILSWVRYERRS